MKATKIHVSAGRTFNHPYEQYSNFRSDASLDAELLEGESPLEAIKAAQAQVEQLAEDHKQNLLKSIHELHDLTLRQREMCELSKELSKSQKRLDEIRKQHPELHLPLLENGESEQEYDPTP